MSGDKADLNSPSGFASDDPGVSARRVLERLSEAECMKLLANGAVRRLAYTSRYGPQRCRLRLSYIAHQIDGGVDCLGHMGSRPL